MDVQKQSTEYWFKVDDTDIEITVTEGYPQGMIISYESEYRKAEDHIKMLEEIIEGIRKVQQIIEQEKK